MAGNRLHGLLHHQSSLTTRREHCYSPFRYPGGKTWLTPLIVRWLAGKVDCIVEPFTGGGNVSIAALSLDLAGFAFLAERDPKVATVWKVMLNGCCDRLVKRVLDLEMSRRSVAAVLRDPSNESIDLAFKTLVRNRVSHGGVIAKGSGLLKNGDSGQGLSSRWYPKTLAARIGHVNSLKDRVYFHAGDGFDLLEALTYLDPGLTTAFFIDPPYSVAGRRLRRLYDHHCVNHAELFRVASSLPGRVLMTYDDSPYIKRLAYENGFKVRKILMRSVRHVKKHELLISRDFSWLAE
jgi:DNA adenine methylase